MNGWTSTVALRIADYYLVATLLLLVAWVPIWLVRQPARRLTIAWVTMIGLACLAVICNLPAWPRVDVAGLFPEGPAPDVSTLSHEEQPDASSAPSGEEGADFSIAQGPGLKRPHGEAKWDDRAAANPAGVLSAQPDSPKTQPIGPTSARPAPLLRAEAASSWDLEEWGKIAVASFSTGVVLVALWLAWGAVQTALLCRRATEAPRQIVAELSRVVGKSHRTPRLLVSPRINNAVVLGIARPTILLPSAVVEEGAREGVRAVLAHEWAHITNRDLWLLAAGRLMLLLLFAHPLFWLLRRRIRRDQETVADVTAAGQAGREAYAEGLVAWARTGLGLAGRRIPAALAIRERPSQLERRIAMLFDESAAIETSSSRCWSFASLATAGLVVLSLSVLTLHPTSSATADPAEPIQATADGDSAQAVQDRPKQDTGGSETHRAAIAAIEKLGGRCTDLSRGDSPRVHVSLLRADVTDEDLKILNDLDSGSLAGLFLGSTPISDAGLAEIEGRIDLKSLHLGRTRITDAGLKRLQGLLNLDTLSLRDTGISDAGLKHLAGLTSLRDLDLSHTRVRGPGLEHLTGLVALEGLNLASTRIEEGSYLKHLSRLPNLKKLVIYRTDIDDSALEHLEALPKLRQLWLGSTRVTDAGLEHLSRLTNLELLNLSRTHITDAGVKHLEGLQALRRLDLSGTKVSKEGVARLQKILASAAIDYRPELGFLPARPPRPPKREIDWNEDGKTDRVEFFGQVFYDGDLADLEKLDQLKELEFRVCRSITDDGLEHLTGLTALERLEFSGCDGISDRGLEHLSRLKNLRELKLARCRNLTDEGLKHIVGLSGLEVLYLTEEQATDEALAHVERLTGLRELTVFAIGKECPITDKGLAHLKDLKNLRRLRIYPPTKITDAGLKHLAGMSNLQDLLLESGQITDAGLAHLKGLTRIRSLHFFRCPGLTGSGLAYLRGLTDLERLFLNNCSIKGRELRHLAAFPNLKRLELDAMDATDADLEPLKNLNHLRRLSLGTVRVSDAALEELRRALPNTDIDEDDHDAIRRWRAVAEPAGRYATAIDESPDAAQRQALGEIQELGGAFRIDRTAADRPLTRLSLARTQVTDDSLKLLGSLTRLEELNLQNTQISSEGLKHLKGLTNLKRLDLSHTEVDDAGLEHLEDLDNLESLFLMGTKVTDEGLAHLKDLTSLRTLSFLYNTGVSDSGIQHLSGLTELRALYLPWSVTDDALQHLDNLTRLEKLSLWNSGISDTGLRHLKGLTRLQMLNLGDTEITDAGLEHLSGLRNLRELRLDGTEVRGPGLAHLHGLPDLEILRLGYTQIGDSGLAHLRDLGSVTRLDLSRTYITDRGLVHLKALSGLRSLSLHGTRLSDAAVERLRQALPDCFID